MNKLLPKMFSFALMLAVLMSLLPIVNPVQAAPALFANPTTTVFINEIHYDNAGTDAGESVEVAGPAGTDLAGWSIVLYNGSGGAVYDTDALGGIIPNQQGGYGAVVLTYPSNGIQNGAPDGIALVNGTTLVQFLSYEGTFSGVGGAANGILSTDIGVSQNGTEPIGSSLQLTGAGDHYGAFTWTTTTAHTFGSPNTGQTFGSGDAAPNVSGTTPASSATNVAINTNIDVTFGEAVNTSGSWFDISCGSSGAHTAAVSGGPTTFTLDPDTDLANGESCTVTVLASQIVDQDTNDPPDNMAADHVFSFGTVNASTAAALVINEIDYDQPGTDTAEFVEIRNNDGVNVDLSSYSIQMINGTGTVQYRLFPLSAVSLAPGDYYVLCANNTTAANCDQDVSPDTDLIQNGAPDAVALLFGASIVDTVSYEGNTGAPYTETSGVGLIDSASGTQSISRCPDSSDTDVNNVDFSERVSTPGSLNACVTDIPPTVSSTNPSNGATNASISTNVDITLSEDVTVGGSWFDITCASSGAHAAAVSGGPLTFTLDTTLDFAFNESCTVTVFAAGVADQDGAPDNMTSNFVFSFTTSAQPFGVCGDPATFIHTIQGSGPTSPLNLATGVIIEGVVVGDYQGAGQFGGFHVQEENADVDADPATSEGIFVFSNSPVSAGDLVRVRGRVFEFSSSGTFLTELSPVTDVSVCSSGNSVTTSSITLPVSSLNAWEAYEGMLVDISQDLTVTETFTLARFGEVSLSVGGRLFNPTTVTTPGAAAIAQQDLNDRSRILLDDGDNQQNIDPTIYPAGGLSDANTLRSGYTVSGLTGVLEQRFGVYRIQPVSPVAFASSNPRPAAPEAVGGRLKVAALNVLNFFTTLDTGTPICGPLGGLACRGANSSFEFDRQRTKILSEMFGLNADVYGLMELQNNASASLQSLVDGLNAATAPGTYAFINTGTIGGDAIKVGLIYKVSKVTPVGAYAILNSSVDPTFIDTLNRPVLAQTFSENLTGERFTVAVNHLKSKGSDCNAVGDPDTGDGQGNCNQTRTSAAVAEANWLASDPTGSGDPDFVLIGDFNSYAKENPITSFLNAGYTNLIDRFVGAHAYSYVFDGQSGYLDHALANATLNGQVSGASEWHINADEPTALDYNVEFKTANQINTFYGANTYRASDHDPLLIGLNLVPQCNGQNATVYIGTNGRIVGGPLSGQTFHNALSGTTGNDVIVGTNNADTILGLGGNDVVCGRGGNDTILGGNGHDTLNGGDGDDAIFGELGNDTIFGGGGKDAILGGDGTDIIDGGPGRDLVDGGLGGDTVAGGDDADSVLGGPGNDALDGGAGTDICSGGLGTDTAVSCETRILIP